MTTFLEARKILAGFEGGPPLPLLVCMSGTPDVLDLYLRASAAERGRSAEIRTLPFNTLGQHLLSDPPEDEAEIFVLFPWDILPEADWRSGVAGSGLQADSLRERAIPTLTRIRRRQRASVLYVPAPAPPLTADPGDDEALLGWLAASLVEVGARLLPPEAFSLGSYLANGNPFPGARVGSVAAAMVDSVLAEQRETRKVLVTDLDGVMWSGVIGEDGLDGIRYDNEGVGFRHFLYQGLLAKLKDEGTLLAAVSRNDPELANGPFERGGMVLKKDDLIAIVASYNAKSAQIARLAEELNLGLDSFVFVDDNPIELEEVKAQLPEVHCLRFPEADEGIPDFFSRLGRLFARSVVTAEDAERTDMYRRRLEGLVPSEVQGSDLTDFLRELEMELTIRDRGVGDRTRVVQLINKTNQFNLNGVRRSDEEVGEILQAGGRLFGVEAGDRTGSHGEILSFLVDADGMVRSFVMSCRVFQRRIEHAFLLWLADQGISHSLFEFSETPRNEPMRRFLGEAGFSVAPDGPVRYDPAVFAAEHASVRELFTFHVPDVIGSLR